MKLEKIKCEVCGLFVRLKDGTCPKCGHDYSGKSKRKKHNFFPLKGDSKNGKSS